MSLFGRQRSYDRERLLREAREVQRQGKHKRTVRLRQLRRVQWNIEPSLFNSWLWLRSRIAS